MKKLLYYILAIVAFSLLCPMSAWAQNEADPSEINTLFVKQTDGTTRSYIFLEEPVVSFTGKELVISLGNRKEHLALAQLSQFTYGYTDLAGLHRVKSDGPIQISKNGDELIVSNLENGAFVHIREISGRTLQTEQATDGSVEISLAPLAKGSYILSVDSFSYKFVK